jgi:hypothetical protein
MVFRLILSQKYPWFYFTLKKLADFNSMYHPSFTLVSDTVTCYIADWGQQFSEGTLGCFQKVFFCYLIQCLILSKLLTTWNLKLLNPPVSTIQSWLGDNQFSPLCVSEGNCIRSGILSWFWKRGSASIAKAWPRNVFFWIQEIYQAFG